MLADSARSFVESHKACSDHFSWRVSAGAKRSGPFTGTHPISQSLRLLGEGLPRERRAASLGTGLEAVGSGAVRRSNRTAGTLGTAGTAAKPKAEPKAEPTHGAQSPKL